MSISNATTYQAHKASNMALRCGAPGCFLLRDGLNAACGKHLSAYRRLGHASAKPLPRSEWVDYATAIEKLFSRNPGHAGLIEADRLVDSFIMRGVASGRAFKGTDEMQRLSTRGVTPREVLVTALSFLEFERHHGDKLPDDRSRTVALARAVFSLAPRDIAAGWRGNRGRPYRRAARPSALVYVGTYLRGALAEFSGRVVAPGLEAQALAHAMTDEQRSAARIAPMVAY